MKTGYTYRFCFGAALLLFILLFTLNKDVQANDFPKTAIQFTENLGQWDKNVLFKADVPIGNIFIENNTPALICFIVGADNSNSSVVFSDRSSEPISYAYNTPFFKNATINIPIMVYTALDAVAINREKIVRNFADLYFPAGITYNIATY